MLGLLAAALVGCAPGQDSNDTATPRPSGSVDPVFSQCVDTARSVVLAGPAVVADPKVLAVRRVQVGEGLYIESDQTDSLEETAAMLIEAPGSESASVPANLDLMMMVADALDSQDLYLSAGYVEMALDDDAVTLHDPPFDEPGTYVLYSYGSLITGEATIACSGHQQPITYSSWGNAITETLLCDWGEPSPDQTVAHQAWTHCQQP